MAKGKTSPRLVYRWNLSGPARDLAQLVGAQFKERKGVKYGNCAKFVLNRCEASNAPSGKNSSCEEISLVGLQLPPKAVVQLTLRSKRVDEM